MKRFILSAVVLCGLLCQPTAAQNTDKASRLLTRLSESIRSMENYEVAFTVEADGQSIKGNYTVSGDKYYLAVAGSEVYCDGTTRYEVNRSNKEVTVDAVDHTSRNILTNPTRAFDFIGGDFVCSIISTRGDTVTLQLTPADKHKAAIGTITVDVNRQTALPRSLGYDADGTVVKISISSIEPMQGMVDMSMFTFDKNNYRGYEIIDFR